MPSVPDILASDPPTRERTLSALAIAELKGRKKRVVYKWVEEGCPCTKRVHRGQTAFFFNVDEVTAWLEQTARPDQLGPETVDPAIVQPPVAAAGTRPLDLFAARAGELRGEIDWDGLVASARESLVRLLETPAPVDAEPAWAAKWRKEVTAAYDALTRMEDRRHEARVRAETWIERQRAERIVEQFGGAFATDTDMLKSDLAAQLALDLAPLVPAEVAEQVRRFIGAAAQKVTDAIRAKRADAIRQALDGLRRAA